MRRDLARQWRRQRTRRHRHKMGHVQDRQVGGRWPHCLQSATRHQCPGGHGRQPGRGPALLMARCTTGGLLDPLCRAPSDGNQAAERRRKCQQQGIGQNQDSHGDHHLLYSTRSTRLRSSRRKVWVKLGQGDFQQKGPGKCGSWRDSIGKNLQGRHLRQNGRDILPRDELTRVAVPLRLILLPPPRMAQGPVAAQAIWLSEGMAMTVCIAGMHRSGTSIAARLLGTAGLYLGPDSDHLPPGPDNPEGLWEKPPLLQLKRANLERPGGRMGCAAGPDRGVGTPA